MSTHHSGFNVETVATAQQQEIRTTLASALRESPIPPPELVRNLMLYLPWQETARTLFIADLYKEVLNVPGVVAELGIRWGRNLALFSTLRASLEPFNHNRKILGFDTFSGLTPPAQQDGESGYAQTGALATTQGYQEHLDKLLHLHEQGLPYEQRQKYELIKGDASVEVPAYLKRHPETVFALVYFDMDLYEPTKKCLEAIAPYTTKGTVLAFDEINHETFPGETVALREVFGLRNIRLRRSPLNPLCGFFVLD